MEGILTTATSWEEIWEAGPYYERISELLDQSKHYAIFVGWQIDSRLPLKSPGRPPEPLKEKILRLCEEKPDFHAYLLMWDHAYFYMFERELLQARIWENAHPRVHFVFDNRHPFGGSHHEKICLIDGKVAFCGGIDLCDDRWDSRQHLYEDPRRSLDGRQERHGPYHDLSVQLGGPICAEIQKHVARRWRALTTIPFPEPPESHMHGQYEILLSRTQGSIDGRIPHPYREIVSLFQELIQNAQKRILVEGQYYWSEWINDLLISKMLEKRTPEFEVILILTDLRRAPSLTKVMAEYEKTLIRRLAEVARYSGCTLRAGAPYVHWDEAGVRRPPKPVYVHSKVLLIDDRYLSVGSANFAGRALNVDTELQLTWIARTDAERAHLRKVGREIESHWNLEGNPAKSLRLLPLTLETREAYEAGDARLSVFKPSLLKALFDPPSPWTEPIKRALGAWSRHGPDHSLTMTFPWITLALSSAVGLITLSPQSTSHLFAPLIFAILGSSWILPVPFLPLLLVLVALAPDDGLRAMVSLIWLNGIVGYGFARVFPTRAALLQELSASNAAYGWFAERSLPTTMCLALDPRLSLKRKIAYQGIRFIPIPWFGLGTGILLPLALTPIILVWQRLWHS